MRTRSLGLLFLVGISLSACGGGSSSGYGGGGSPSVYAIVITAPSSSVAINSTVQFSATAKDASGNPLSGVTFSWASSNPSAVTINSAGLATGVASGQTQITATASGVTSNALKLLAGSASSVSGTAAHGAAIANATLTLVDAKGNQATATTTTSGSYSLTTTGMTPPFLVQVTYNGTPYYSVSADTSTSSIINVTPLTDLIVRTWYNVQGTNVTAGFTNPATVPPPPPAEVQLISNVVVQVMSLWLQNAGVSTANFSPISTAFTPNGSGVDAVLAETTINTNSGAITVSGTVSGTTVTQNSTLGNSGSSVTVTTTTSGGGNSSTSTSTSTIPASSAAQAALAGIDADLTAFAATINSKGANLAASDLTPYLDPSLLLGGLNETQQASEIATNVRGSTVAFQVTSLNSLDTTNNVADVNLTLTVTKGQLSQTQTSEFFFKAVNGSWLFSGDQHIAELALQAQCRTSQGALTTNSCPAVNAGVEAPTGTVTAVTLSGGNAAAQAVFNNTPLPQESSILDTFAPTPTTTLNVTLDQFAHLSGVLSSLLPAGSPFTFTLTTAGGPVSYTLLTKTFTTEPVTITTNFGGTAIGNANLGSAQTVSWKLPVTYAIASIKLNAEAFTGAQSNPATLTCIIDGPTLATNATSGSLTIPTTCNGAPVLQVDLSVQVNGVDGEQSQTDYFFQ